MSSKFSSIEEKKKGELDGSNRRTCHLSIGEWLGDSELLPATSSSNLFYSTSPKIRKIMSLCTVHEVRNLKMR